MICQIGQDHVSLVPAFDESIDENIRYDFLSVLVNDIDANGFCCPDLGTEYM